MHERWERERGARQISSRVRHWDGEPAAKMSLSAAALGNVHIGRPQWVLGFGSLKRRRSQGGCVSSLLYVHVYSDV